jgi:hypothetical protein
VHHPDIQVAAILLSAKLAPGQATHYQCSAATLATSSTEYTAISAASAAAAAEAMLD